eukprot:6177869-Pyramimonas_sp.AAC.1
MAPPCTPYGRFSNLNMVNAQDSWMESYRRCRTLEMLCGEVAVHQFRKGRAFLNENPAGSKLYKEPPWQKVARSLGVVYEIVDLRAAGLKSARGLSRGALTDT